jgi:hypothetical protein
MSELLVRSLGEIIGVFFMDRDSFRRALVECIVLADPFFIYLASDNLSLRAGLISCWIHKLAPSEIGVSVEDGRGQDNIAHTKNRK